MRPFSLVLITILSLAACSSESRDRLWQTLDPAGYKHAHSEVFNPKKYRRDVPRGPDEENEISELPPLQ
jgi:hypothetical protein